MAENQSLQSAKIAEPKVTKSQDVTKNVTKEILILLREIRKISLWLIYQKASDR